MIKYISLDLQGTLSDSKFSDYFWIEFIPQKYSEKNKISIQSAKEILKQKFKEYGVYNILYQIVQKGIKLDKFEIRPSINKKMYSYLQNLNLPKIIVSTTTELFINYELEEKVKEFEKIYSCVDYFKIGGKTKEVYENIAKELNVKPSEILHIGDNYCMDIENAKKAGVNVILYDDNVDSLIYNIEKYL